MSAVHQRLSLIIVTVAAVGALWSLLTLVRPASLAGLRVYLRLTLAVVALQVVVGLVLVIAGQRPSPLHWFYGAATLVALPIATVLGGRGPAGGKRTWIIGGAVATVLFAIRAITTA